MKTTMKTDNADDGPLNRMVRQYRERRDNGLLANYFVIRRLTLGIGWLPGWWKLEDCWPFAVNRNVSWRYDRAVCISILWLRIGIKILPND
jgi:hypothetical protein